MSYFQSKALLIAKSLGAKDWSHPRVLGAIRRAIREGATTAEIHAQFWPNITYATVLYRLKKFNLKPKNRSNLARFGGETGFPRKDGANFAAPFKARVIAELKSL